MSKNQTIKTSSLLHQADFNNRYAAYMKMFISEEKAIEYMRIGEISDVWFSIFGAVIGIIASISLIVNSGILLVFNRAFRRPNAKLLNFNLVFLAISDIGMCINALTFTLHACSHHGWQMGVFACKMDAFLGGFYAFLQINTLCEIALQRYTMVKSMDTNVKAKTVIFRLTVVFIISLVIAGLPFTGFGRFMLEGILVNCSINYVENDPVNLAFVIFINIVGLFVPCFIIAFSYVGILKICKRSRQRIDGAKSTQQRQADKIKKREMRLAKRAVFCFLFFFFTWAPYSFMSIFSMAGFIVPHLLVTFAVIIAKASTAVNGAFYVANHPDVYKELQRHLPFLLTKTLTSETRSSASGERFLSKRETSLMREE